MTRVNSDNTMDMSLDHTLKVASDCKEEDEETCADSGSSCNGEEEVSCSCPSEEEEGEVPKAVECASPEQSVHLEDASKVKEQPARTKLSSNALVFVPGASTTSLSGTQSSKAGRELLTLLKGNSEDRPSGQQSEIQEKPHRSKLSSSAQAFVPQATFIPQPNVVIQPARFNPVVQLFPALLMPLPAMHDGFDDSPRATDPDSQPELAKDVDDNFHEGHPPDAMQQSVESQGVVVKPAPKISWADLYEDDEDLGPDLWLRASN